jgi:predicted helicase
MEKKGKGLEKVIQLIEETLKDSPETIIHKNHKVKNSGGRMREFDVFIESKVNGYDIKIAIECKDYKTAIPAEKIEAFETKCNRVKSISKKVFISTNGFQAEAINVAKDCGIELRIASKLNSNLIASWFPIVKINIKLLTGGSVQIFLTEDEEYLQRQ